jgi:2-methylisocitrate lyase-like PEP mutase family enzyme
MSERNERARVFRALHVPRRPLILYNVWDAGSAAAVARAGALAIATGSWSVAAAQGFGDGEQLPFEAALATLARIVAGVVLPVSIDLEAGYGASPAAVADSVRAVADAGAVGFNIEDGVAGGDIRPPDEQAARIAAAREADAAMFINARIDLFLRSGAGEHATLFDEATERANAYAEAGADGIFIPGLADAALIRRFCQASPRPVNIMAAPGSPSREQLAGLGVARISHGPFPYRSAIAALEEEARAALSD